MLHITTVDTDAYILYLKAFHYLKRLIGPEVT